MSNGRMVHYITYINSDGKLHTHTEKPFYDLDEVFESEEWAIFADNNMEPDVQAYWEDDEGILNSIPNSRLNR